MRVSVIVPVLNEATSLPALLPALQQLKTQGAQLLLVDGASQDATVALAEQAGFRVIQAPRGRAAQMNAGAAQAQGDIFLFLHADTRLPEGVLKLVQARLSQQQVWGRFDVSIEGQPRMLRVVAALMNLRSRLTGMATGDQALFMTRQAFALVGGFPALALMEDIEMSRRLKRLSPPVCLRAKVITSGRRWETRGVWRTIFLMWRLRWAYWRGVPASELARAYR